MPRYESKIASNPFAISSINLIRCSASGESVSYFSITFLVKWADSLAHLIASLSMSRVRSRWCCISFKFISIGTTMRGFSGVPTSMGPMNNESPLSRNSPRYSRIDSLTLRVASKLGSFWSMCLSSPAAVEPKQICLSSSIFPESMIIPYKRRLRLNLAKSASSLG
jgi:hypothetical protein